MFFVDSAKKTVPYNFIDLLRAFLGKLFSPLCRRTRHHSVSFRRSSNAWVSRLTMQLFNRTVDFNYNLISSMHHTMFTPPSCYYPICRRSWRKWTSHALQRFLDHFMSCLARIDMTYDICHICKIKSKCFPMTLFTICVCSVTAEDGNRHFPPCEDPWREVQ